MGLEGLNPPKKKKKKTNISIKTKGSNYLVHTKCYFLFIFLLFIQFLV